MKRVRVKDFLEYRYLSALEVSPDGKTVVFCVSQPREEENNYSSGLWRYSSENRKTEFISGTEGVKRFCFLDHDRILYPFLEGEDKKREEAGEFLTVFWEHRLSDGKRKERFRVPLKGASAFCIREGLFLLRSMRYERRPDLESMREPERREALKKWKQSQDVIVCEELPFMSDGRGYINGQRNGLYLYDEKEERCIPVTEPFFETSFWAVSPDGRYIAYSGASYDRYYVRTHGIYYYGVETGRRRTILTPGSYQVMGLGFLSEELVVAAAPWNGLGAYPNHDLYTISLEGRAMRLQYAHRNGDFGNKSCSDCKYGEMTSWRTINGTLYYMTTEGTGIYLNRWRPGNVPQKLNRKELIPMSMAVGGDGSVYVIGSEMNLPELYRLEENRSEIRLTRLNEDVLTDSAVSEPKEFIFLDHDGFEIHGFVAEPVGYEPGRSYPGLLEIHGGPRMAFTRAFFHEIQCLCSEGYFVFYCNPRGSAGSGEAFADIKNRRGTVDYQDLMEWTDFVLKQYSDIDRKRLGVLGGSYGGYMTNWIIGHTNRFAAAVSMRSIVDLSGSFGAKDYGVWGTPGVYGGTPWENEEKLKEQSPFTYAINIVTPTLLLHSLEDHRCAVAGAMQLYSLLQMKGVPTRLCLFQNECHELSRTGRPISRVRRLEEIIMWLNRWLLLEEKEPDNI